MNRWKLAAVEGRDRSNQRHFPIASFAEDDQIAALTKEQAARRFSKIILEPQTTQNTLLSKSELTAFGCTSLAIIDSNGKPWPVQQFNPDELNDTSAG